MEQHTEMTDASENGEVTHQTRPCLGSEVAVSVSSTSRLLSEESSEHCTICSVEHTSPGPSDPYSVCDSDCEGTHHTSHTVDDNFDVCSSEESVAGCANRSSVCNGVSTHKETDFPEPSKETEASSGTAMSVTVDGCTTDTQRTDLSSDMLQPDSSSADSVAGDSPESDVSVSEDCSDTAENETANDSKKSHVTAHDGDTVHDNDGTTEDSSSNTAENGKDTAHDTDTAHDSDGTAEEDSSDTTHNNDPNHAQDQHPLSGPHRRRHTSRQERRQQQQPPHHPLRRLNIPPSVMAQWRAVGRQWGVDNDDDIAHVLMRHYEDVIAGRPPRPPPHQLCPECGEVLRPVPCGACGPHQHSFRLAHDSGGGGNSSGGKGSSCCP